jgi:hypothetical protein
LKELARPDTGLKTLTSLDLSSNYGHLTDAGLKELARPDTGLKALTSLNLMYAKATFAGVRAVKERWPGIEIKQNLGWATEMFRK